MQNVNDDNPFQLSDDGYDIDDIDDDNYLFFLMNDVHHKRKQDNQESNKHYVHTFHTSHHITSLSNTHAHTSHMYTPKRKQT